MNNLQKFSRLVKFFASCDFDHNNNQCDIEAFDNGFKVTIEFCFYKSDMLLVDFNYKYSDNDFSIQMEHEYILTAFTFDFDKLDELLTKIFSEVIKTDISTLSTDMESNSSVK